MSCLISIRAAAIGKNGSLPLFPPQARRAGAAKLYGLDMTDNARAGLNENMAGKAGAENVKFLKGEIENIPCRTNSVASIISNCVINLSC